jgi:hypothetical protein
MVGKDELCKLSELEATDPKFVKRIRNYSAYVFNSLCEILTIQPETRRENIAQKRAKGKQLQLQSSQSAASETSMQDSTANFTPTETASTHTSAPAVPTPLESIPSSSSRRIFSGASVADPNQDSAGSRRTWASNEKASDMFGNNFISCVLNWIWPEGVTLDWVKGREGETSLVWNCWYIPSVKMLISH